jgi:cytochrome c biogenesis protein CcmG/thiol:disulfide interchange protein DsbE
MANTLLFSRPSFIRAALLTSAALAGVSPRAASADGARSGSWCRDLSKVAREDAYDFSLYLLDGEDKIFTLSDYLGRPIWLQFFASWCGPCNREAADVVRIASKYGDAIVTVGIDVKEQPERARAFRDLHKIPFPITLDGEAKVFDSLGFRGFPTHMFVDARGLISCLTDGDLTPAQMDNEIAVALSRPGKPQAKAFASPAPPGPPLNTGTVRTSQTDFSLSGS